MTPAPKTARATFATRWLATRFLLAGAGAILPCSNAAARVFDVPPGPASAISEAAAQAEPGDVIQLHSGTYFGTVTISRPGLPDRPITLCGPSGEQRAVIDGQGTPGNGQRHQAFKVTDAGWIVIRDIDAKNCWTNIVDIRDSPYISVESCRFLNCGKTAVFANGPKTHHVLVENCTWSQDERVYSTWDWAEMHHESLKHFNGGLYGGSDAGGGSVIRFNTVHDVFNGLRWFMGEASAAKKQFQDNIEIYDNTFYRCRDNCIEPECFAWNLHVYHNRLDSCPSGVFSIDGVAGGEIFIYGNTGFWNPKNQPGPRRGVVPSPVSWCLFKFSDYARKPGLDQPLYIYNNSWSYDRAFPHGARVRKADDRVIARNNAYFHQTNQMGLDEWPGKECSFDYDISSRPWSPDVAKLGFERHGIPNTDPKFVAPQDGDFRLSGDSRAIGAGEAVKGFTLWYTGAAPDMGAYEDGQPVYGMPFVHRDPPGGTLYQEMPRIVRIFSRGDRLAVFFSEPLDPATFSRHSLRLSANGQPVEVKAVHFAGEPQTQAVSLTLARPLPPDIQKLDAAFGEDHPAGVNGQQATLWAADSRVVRVPEGATLVGVMSELFPGHPEKTN